MKKAIIIDDVEKARNSLKQDLKDYCPEVEIIGEADGVISGAKLIREHQPEMVFLDVHMNDGTGFDLLEILPEINFNLIFTTSSDEHAIKAFKFSAVDYLLKPIDPEELQVAVQKTGDQDDAVYSTLKQNMDEGPKRLALNSQDKIKVVKIDDVVRCESSGSYTLFYTTEGEQVLVTRTLKEYDNLLTEHGFVRVHQSHLINMDFIKEFVKTDGGYLVLNDKTEIPVASRKRSLVMKVLTEM
ncbi:MAG: response regulator transcription factor [Flavobacteriales bacterium]|nr:response regulator transcription factor [Flavobacteriales bacterium]